MTIPRDLLDYIVPGQYTETFAKKVDLTLSILVTIAVIMTNKEGGRKRKTR